MLLLLIWRHLAYYAEGRGGTGPGTAGNAMSLSKANQLQPQPLRSSTMRFLVVPDAETFQQDAARAVARVLEKLEGLELVRRLSFYS